MFSLSILLPLNTFFYSYISFTLLSPMTPAEISLFGEQPTDTNIIPSQRKKLIYICKNFTLHLCCENFVIYFWEILLYYIRL